VHLRNRPVRIVGTEARESAVFIVSNGRDETLIRTAGDGLLQRGHNLSSDLREIGVVPRFLIRDRDTKFTRSFDAIFEGDGTRIITTPIRAPNANAQAERWVSTVRAECLDWVLVRGRRHLERVLREYVTHYNGHGPHRARGLHPPADRGGRPHLQTRHQGAISRRPILGGLINEYRAAA